MIKIAVKFCPKYKQQAKSGFVLRNIERILNYFALINEKDIANQKLIKNIQQKKFLKKVKSYIKPKTTTSEIKKGFKCKKAINHNQ